MKNFSFEIFANYLGISVIYIKVIVAFLVSFLLVFMSIPKVIRVSYRKQLMDVPGYRSSHASRIPNLGGVAIFFSVTVVSAIISPETIYNYHYFPASLAILFFIGLMDDLLIVAPKKKLYAQIVSSLLLIIGSDVRIESLFGIFGIFEITYWASVLLTLVVFVVLINSYNLIDGIDGLAGGVGALISLSYVFIFFRLYDYSTGLLAIITMGSLLAFLKFNLSTQYKIFMGDTGSMVVGFLLAFLSVKFINLSTTEWLNVSNAPIIAIAILIVPIIDTVSVIIIRLSKGKSPFTADKNHIHHRILRLGFSHIETTVLICSANFAIIVFAYLIWQLNANLMLFLIIIASLLFSYIPLFILEKSKRTKKNKQFNSEEKFN